MSFRDILWLDFETRSQVDLNKHGVYRYVADPSHQILVAGWALNDEAPTAAIVANGRRLPVKLCNMLANPKVQIRAHNAAFERHQLRAVGMDIPYERWYCTMAQARAVAMPGSLANLGKALDAKLQKASSGTNLMKLLSIPDVNGNFSNDPHLMRQYADYCAVDVGSMRDASQCLPAMRDEDLRVYWASERVNDRGLPIDTELCRLATQYAADEKEEAQARLFELTAGMLTKTQGKSVNEWVWDRLDPSLRHHMVKITVRKKHVRLGQGVCVSEHGEQTQRAFTLDEEDTYVHEGKSLALDVRARLLEIAAEDPEAIDAEALAVIELVDDASMSSVAKFQTMLDRVSADGRLRGAFTFNGASQTNRWTSTGAQVHNFPREVAKDPETVLLKMKQNRRLRDVMHTLKTMLRPAITAKGRMIVRCDWNAIEARGLPWLADNAGGREYMQAFTEEGRDLYVEQSHAAGLGGDRQPGKVVVLSMGYGGAVNALTRMARAQGVRIADAQGVVNRWRQANPWLSNKRTGWWYSLGRCAMMAMSSTGQSFRAGRVSLMALPHGDDKLDLTMTLPSGRRIWYPQARIVEGLYGPEIAYMKAAWTPKKGAKDWPTARLWHGVLAENADQAMCADLLREAVVRCEEQGLEVIGHVHDEIIVEAAPSRAKAQGRKLERCMLVLPEWAKGLPLKAEVDISPRFRK